MNSFISRIVHLIRNVRERGLKATEVEVVVDLMEQVAQRGSVAIAGARKTAEMWREFLLNGLLKHGAAHDSASCI